MSDGLFAASMFPALFLLIFLGIPVSFSLICVAFAYGWFVFDSVLGGVLGDRLYGIASSPSLSAVPLFIFMGAMLERSSIAAKLFDAMKLWLGRLPGGLAIATIGMCAIFAASTGIIGAVEVVVGMMAIPAMMKLGYHKGLISGTICAGGSLGTIIPPSIVVIIYGSIAELSIGELFAGIIIPGGLMVVLFMGYILVRTMLRPEDGPPVPLEVVDIPLGRKIAITITSILPATLLVTAVLGAILTGIASPTEAAAVGAVGAILLTAFYRELSLELLWSSMRQDHVFQRIPGRRGQFAISRSPFRPDLVRGARRRCHPDGLPDATDGAGSVLPANGGAEGNHVSGYVQGRGTLCGARDHRPGNCHRVSVDGNLSAIRHAWLRLVFGTPAI